MDGVGTYLGSMMNVRRRRAIAIATPSRDAHSLIALRFRENTSL